MISHIFYRYNIVYVALCVIYGIHIHGWYYVLAQQNCRHPKAILAFLNIGQGDSIYMQDTTGATVLIDTGPKDGNVISRIQEVTHCKDIHIDTLMLTLQKQIITVRLKD